MQKILTATPAAPGWRAVYCNLNRSEEPRLELVPVFAFALVEEPGGHCRIAPLVSIAGAEPEAADYRVNIDYLGIARPNENLARFTQLAQEMRGSQQQPIASDPTLDDALEQAVDELIAPLSQNGHRS